MNKDDREELIRSLGKKGALKILDLLAEKKEMSFNEIARNVGYAVTANRVLKEFTKLGIVRKKEVKDKLKTIKYGLTDKGWKMKEIMTQLMKI
jgi:DNA-binding HxlR family transcriptional regulator